MQEDNLDGLEVPGLGEDGQGEPAPELTDGQGGEQGDPIDDGNDGSEVVSMEDYLRELGVESEEELRSLLKSNKEAQRKITEQAMELAALKKGTPQASVAAEDTAIPGDEQTGGTDEFVDKLFENPQETLREFMRSELAKQQEEEKFLSETQGSIIDAVHAELSKELSPEEMRLVADEIESNAYLSQSLENISNDAFKQYSKEEIQKHLMEVIKLAKYAALGKNIGNIEKKMKAEVKQKHLRRVHAAATVPLAGGQKGSRAAKSFSGSVDEMNSIFASTYD